jgi:hypothetical protein
MFGTSKSRWIAFALLLTGIGATSTAASAITVEVAKKCDALAAKAFPPRVVGNPAAGSAKGTPQEQRDYFKKCVANGGNMDGASDKSAK